MKFYVSTYTEGFFGEGPNGSQGIYLCDYNEKTNTFNVLNNFDNSVNPSFIKLSTDKKSLFVACEKLPPSRLDNYLVDENGNLRFNDSVTLDYRSCCYVGLNKENKFVAVANYGSGEVFTYSYNDEYKFDNLTSSNRNDVSLVGPNNNRQELPHAHSVRLIEKLNTYVACDLGCDKVSFYDYKDGGYFSESSIKPLTITPGYGPRHTDNTSDGKFLYITCELENRILTYELVNDQYILRQDISSIPETYSEGNTCADIHLSEDEKYVFVSNRGHDSIVQYIRLEDGTLKEVTSVYCDGKGPRNFAVTSNYIICANQDSNNVSILEMMDGILTGRVLSRQDFISPVCIEKY